MVRGRKRIVHPAGMIICSRCKTAKPYDEYHLSRKSNTGYRSYCKDCWSEYMTGYYDRNKETYRQRYQDKRGKLLAYQKMWNEGNAEVRAKYRELYYSLLCNVLWKNAQARYRGVAVSKNIDCGMNFRELVDCTKHELLERFRSLYKLGMTDMNYGEWEIDHIRPICSFDLTKDEDVIQCFHYTNMQPLWREENQAKGTSWSG